jgi:hypothetical protein
MLLFHNHPDKIFTSLRVLHSQNQFGFWNGIVLSVGLYQRPSQAIRSALHRSSLLLRNYQQNGLMEDVCTTTILVLPNKTCFFLWFIKNETMEAVHVSVVVGFIKSCNTDLVSLFENPHR